MALLNRIKLGVSEVKGAVVIAIVVIVVAIFALTRQQEQSAKVAQELNEAAAQQMSEHDVTEATETTESIGQHPKIGDFDPNDVELKSLLDMGFTKYEALSIIRYRASGKVFHIKEELIMCYGISDSLYFALEPYIKIAEKYQYKKREVQSYNREYATSESVEPKRTLLAPSEFLIDTVSAKYLYAIGALTMRQAATFVKWRDMSGIENLEELKGCYSVSDSVAIWLARYAIFTPKESAKRPTKMMVELNSADSTELISVYGIGAKSAAAIMDYREKLGGFHSKEQLSEIKIITESNFEKIIQQISVDNCDISKIDINFATAKALSRHPYFTSIKIRRLLKARELKGGWRTIEEMIEDNIFTTEEAQRVRPYLHFEVQDPL